MPLNIIADFFNLINVPMFDTITVVFVVSFIVWEIPRSVKLISDEYTKGLYPETGRVVDFVLLFMGLLSIGYFVLDNNSERIVTFLKTPGITAAFLILMLAIPLIIALGYFKRLFGRMEGHNSVTVFITHGFLDLMHTLFHISLVILFVPAVGHLLFGPK
jgi:fumarate reductase subunit D